MPQPSQNIPQKHLNSHIINSSLKSYSIQVHVYMYKGHVLYIYLLFGGVVNVECSRDRKNVWHPASLIGILQPCEAQVRISSWGG